jgi:hypothetical protein
LMRAPQPKKKMKPEPHADGMAEISATKSTERLEEAPARMASFRHQR